MCWKTWEPGSHLYDRSLTFFFGIVVSNYNAPINKLIESIFGGNYLQFMFNDQASTAAATVRYAQHPKNEKSNGGKNI